VRYNGRGRSRTYRGRLAPSNGFEARASHRTRCSSKPILQVLGARSKAKAPASSGQPNASLPRSTMRASPVRRVAPILSRYSRIAIVRLRPTPERSLKVAAVNVRLDQLGTHSNAPQARLGFAEIVEGDHDCDFQFSRRNSEATITVNPRYFPAYVIGEPTPVQVFHPGKHWLRVRDTIGRKSSR